MKSFQQMYVFVILLTLTALSCSSVAELPNLFATETPTPTMTLTPSPTFTPSPTATQTVSPTPVPTGTMVEEQSDGSTSFTDYDHHFRVVLPEDWLIVPFKKDDFTEVINELRKDNPQLAEAAESFQNMDPKLFRVVAFNKNPDYILNTYVSNLNITAIPDSLMASMPLAFVTGALEEEFTKSGFKVLTNGVNEIDNSYGVEVEYIDIEQTVNGMKTLQRVIVFQSDGSLCMITVTTLPQFSKDIFTSADTIGATIELLK